MSEATLGPSSWRGRLQTAVRAMPWSAWLGLAIVAANIVLALLGGWMAPHGPGEFVTTVAYAPPSAEAPLGSDYLSRDVLSRLLHGARLTLGLSVLSTVLGFVSGMALGFTAAIVGGWTDNIIGRVVDVLISFPPLLLALVMIAGLGSSITVLVLVVGLIHSSRVARISRAIAMNISVLDFVEAARARGERRLSIIIREIWPNSIRPLAAEFGLRLTFSVLLVSSLSFLGLGVPPPAADWGGMVRENLGGLYYGAWGVLIPALAIGVLTVGINLVVDWLASQSGRDLSGGFR
jgi:peptide/nickel transport system permease protein